MKYLLDVNVLLAAAWVNHPQYAAADAWLKGKSVVVCPLAECIVDTGQGSRSRRSR